MELTADDVRDLRAATAVSFHRVPLVGTAGTHHLQLHREITFDDVTVDFTRTLPVGGSLHDYARRVEPGQHLFAFYYLSAATYSRRWATITESLRPGCELALQWIGGNNTPALENSGFDVDELSVTVTHRRGRTQEFLVDVNVSRRGPASMLYTRDTPGADPSCGPYATPTDVEVLCARVATILDACPHRRRATLAVPADRAAAIGSSLTVPTTRGTVEVMVRSDHSRQFDEFVLLDAAVSKLLGAGNFVPRELADLGTPAAQLYEELRAQGVVPHEAAEVVAATLRTVS